MKLPRSVLMALVFCCASSWAVAQTVLPDGARMTVERATKLDSFAAPIGPFSDGVVPAQVIEGSITRTAWRIETSGVTPLQVVAPLRAQIENLGYRVAFECESKACGGFDFRFSVEILPGPNMYINLASYRYLTAFKGPPDAPIEALTVLASVTATSAYVQIIHAATDAEIAETQDAPTAPVPVNTPSPSAATDLLTQGFMILEGLDFASGTANLGAGPFASLDKLSKLLTQRTDLRVALVGHTDAVGSLDANIALSRARARAVRARLIEQYGIDANRLDAEGMGYLAPVASNLTPAGRSQNRRVEVVILNVE